MGLPKHFTWLRLIAVSSDWSSSKSTCPNPLNSPVTLSSTNRTAFTLHSLKKSLTAGSSISHDRLPMYTVRQPGVLGGGAANAGLITLLVSFSSFFLHGWIFSHLPPLHSPNRDGSETTLAHTSCHDSLHGSIHPLQGLCRHLTLVHKHPLHV